MTKAERLIAKVVLEHARWCYEYEPPNMGKEALAKAIKELEAEMAIESTPAMDKFKDPEPSI